MQLYEMRKHSNRHLNVQFDKQQSDYFNYNQSLQCVL